ncbi:MAG: serine/threonine-protein kinase [Polyangiaceae bacterium]
MTIGIGSIVDGKYRVTRQIGKGGMGAVFAAEHTRIRRQVAIKVLHAEVAGSAELAQRFEREAQAAAQIGSQHIVDVLDCGLADDGERFMVMEYLDGETLRQRLKRGGRMSPEQAAPIFMQLLEGLAAAHAAGIIHRDLKPDNVYLERARAGQTDWVKILDFGISKFSEVGGEEQMTRTGAVMGTLFFMSPEQARSANLVDARSDLYSVGAMLFQALTGDVPFRATTLAEMLFKIVFDPLPHPREREPGLQDDICSVILKAIGRDPAQRFQSALEFREALVPFVNRSAGVPSSLAAIAAPRASGPISSAGSSGAFPQQVGTPVSAAGLPVATPPPPVAEALELSSSNLATSASMAVASGSVHTGSSEQSLATASAPRSKSKTVPIAIAAVVGLLAVGGVVIAMSGSSGSPSAASTTATSKATTDSTASTASTAAASTASAAATPPAQTATATAAASAVATVEPMPAPSASVAPPAQPVATTAAAAAPADTSKPAAKPATTAKPAGKPGGKGPSGFDLGY